MGYTEIAFTETLPSTIKRQYSFSLNYSLLLIETVVHDCVVSFLLGLNRLT